MHTQLPAWWALHRKEWAANGNVAAPGVFAKETLKGYIPSISSSWGGGVLIFIFGWGSACGTHELVATQLKVTSFRD